MEFCHLLFVQLLMNCPIAAKGIFKQITLAELVVSFYFYFGCFCPEFSKNLITKRYFTHVTLEIEILTIPPVCLPLCA